MAQPRRSAALLVVSSIAALVSGARCPELPRAVVAPSRSEHLLDRPFPSDELRGPEGAVRLEGFPASSVPLGQLFLSGWLAQVEGVVRGFSAMTPIYFRVDADPGLRERYEGEWRDPVRLISLDSDHRVPVRVRYVADAQGDPFLRDGLLVVTPDETEPLRSGERYACLVSLDVVRPAPGWRPPAELPASLRGRLGVATVFTVQDHVGELATLRTATDAAIDETPGILDPTPLREVTGLRYEQGTTPSGQSSTIETVTFDDGGSETTFLNNVDGLAALALDLTAGPMRVFQTTIETVAFQDPEGRPYQSPGLGILSDTERTDGWIRFDAGGDVVTGGQTEPVRVVIQVPRDVAPERVLVWGHGSGGDAYAAIQRRNPANQMPEIRARLAALGTVLVSVDQPLFGRRFPLIDQGYETNLAVVNVPNLPAFRAAMQQGAVDQHVLLRFARERLPAALAAVGEGAGLDPRRLAIFGHSIGAQITGVAVGLHQASGPAAVMLSGTSGFQTHSVLASDLFRLDGIAGTIFLIAGVPLPPDPTPPRVLGALFGVPPEAWEGIDRFHPLGMPFQLVIDGGDPLPLAASHGIPVTVFQGVGDTFVPEDGPGWIASASQDGERILCTPGGAYDGHFCIYREETGFAAFEALVEGL